MRELEVVANRLHASRRDGGAPNVTSMAPAAESTNRYTNPFLRVDQVAEGSPAEVAVSWISNKVVCGE